MAARDSFLKQLREEEEQSTEHAVNAICLDQKRLRDEHNQTQEMLAGRTTWIIDRLRKIEELLAGAALTGIRGPSVRPQSSANRSHPLLSSGRPPFRQPVLRSLESFNSQRPYTADSRISSPSRQLPAGPEPPVGSEPPAGSAGGPPQTCILGKGDTSKACGAIGSSSCASPKRPPPEVSQGGSPNCTSPIRLPPAPIHSGRAASGANSSAYASPVGVLGVSFVQNSSTGAGHSWQTQCPPQVGQTQYGAQLPHAQRTQPLAPITVCELAPLPPISLPRRPMAPTRVPYTTMVQKPQPHITYNV